MTTATPTQTRAPQTTTIAPNPAQAPTADALRALLKTAAGAASKVRIRKGDSTAVWRARAADIVALVAACGLDNPDTARAFKAAGGEVPSSAYLTDAAAAVDALAAFGHENPRVCVEYVALRAQNGTYWSGVLTGAIRPESRGALIRMILA